MMLNNYIFFLRNVIGGKGLGKLRSMKKLNVKFLVLYKDIS